MEGDKGGWPPQDPDDDYDALNDETFGDDSTAEFNWEEAQTMLNDFEKLKPNGKTQREVYQSDRVGFGQQELDLAFDKELSKTLEDDFDNENALEESISRLVMDDFDDDDEETEARKNKLRRLGGSGASLNTYFMPPQVANKHLQWFMDKELPGGSSLLGSSVWSMHPTTTPADVIGNHQANVAMSRNASDSRPTAPQKLPDARISPNLINVARTKPNSSLPSKKPVFKTVEEIERELLDGSDVSSDASSQSKSVINHRPRVMTAEELERELMDDSTRTKKLARELPTSPIKVHHQSSPDTATRQNLPGSPSLSQNIVTTGSPGRPPPGMNVNMTQMMMQRMSHPHMGQNPAAFAQRMMANVQMQHQVAAQLAFQQHQQQHMRMMHMNPQMRGRLPMMMPFPPMHVAGRPGFHMHSNQGPHPQFLRHFRSDDPYRGLMNEKDKQRLRNIQIVQLQNDHPYTTDYYSLMFRVRHGSSDPKRQRDYLLKLYPKKCDESSNRNNYQPAHFENSLGKLQAVSALAPKKAIDTVIRVVDAGPTNRSGMKAYRYLLLEIEKLYECLLKIQEGDIRKSLLMNADENTLEQRNENERKVREVLEPRHKLSEILSVHKGKMLVSRLMPLMDQSFRFSLLSHMIRNFPDWGVSKSNEIDTTYPFLRHCIFSADMSNILTTFNSVVTPVYECMLSRKLGISLLMAVFHRAECIIETSPPDDEKAEVLSRLYLKGMDSLIQTVLSNVHTLAMPIEFPSNILKHFARLGYQPDQLQQFASTLILWDKHSTPIMKI